MQTQLLDKIHTRTAQVAIIGLGYVGLPLAVAFDTFQDYDTNRRSR